MSELVYAPWTDEQVEALEEWQNNDEVHPYTCTCGDSLTPYPNGWECDYCHNYTQNWCHDFSLLPQKKEPKP
jgi:hypothetical protein